MTKLLNQWRQGFTRREALSSFISFLAASPLLHAQRDPWPLDQHRRYLGFDELLTAFDFEPVFRANVPLSIYDVTAHEIAMRSIGSNLWGEAGWPLKMSIRRRRFLGSR